MLEAYREEEDTTLKVGPLLKQAEDWILQAETSCYFFWGDARIPKAYKNITQARRYLTETEQLLH